MNKLYPLKYADKSWDNTGLLIDSSVEDGDPSSSDKATILLTIDLTESVAREAIENRCNVIIAYHPFLFRKFNRIEPTKNSQQRTLMKLIQHNISVYSPHTSVDAAKGGVNDWLVEGVSRGSTILKTEVIVPDKSGAEGYGMGRIVEFEEPVALEQVVQRIKKSLGIQHFQLTTRNDVHETTVKRIALCAGSGSGVFTEIQSDVDLYYTGELSHHELLAYSESDKTTITCGHTNTERGFLGACMLPSLQKELPDVKIFTSVNDMNDMYHLM